MRPETPRAVLLKVASDERLVAQVRAGSERAFEALFERHRRGVFAYCRRMLGSTADAEDAVQHTFLAAYRDLMCSQKSIVLRPWLYMIARHRCLSVLRDRRQRPVDALSEAEVDRLAADVDTREDLRTALADIERLPDDQRAALILAAFGDVSHDEVARMLGCHRDKVKALVFQARFSLRADRAAREMRCADVREQLVTSRGALRNRHLRRHVRACDGCRAFRHEVRIQRRRVRVLVPVAPVLALRRAVVGAVSGWGGAGAGGAAVTAGALGGGGVVVTALVAVTIASSNGSADEVRSDPVRTVAASESGRYIESRAAADEPRTERVPARRVRERAVGDVHDVAGSVLAERPGQREADGHGVPRVSDARGEHGAEPDPVVSGEAERPASGDEQATEPGSAEGEDSHDRVAPSAPEGRPDARGQGKSGRSPASNGGRNRSQSPPANRGQKPSNPPTANGKGDSASPRQRANPPSGPPPGAGQSPSAPSQSSPPGNPGPEGSGKPTGNDGGNGNGQQGAGNGPSESGSGQHGGGHGDNGGGGGGNGGGDGGNGGGKP